MKNRALLITFLIVFILNSFLGGCLYKFNNDFSVQNIIPLFLLSLIVFWLFYGYLVFIKKNKPETFYLTTILGVLFSAVCIFVILFNIKNSPVLFFPLMFLVSMFGIFILMIIKDHEK